MTEPMVAATRDEKARRWPFLSVPFLGPAKTRLGLFVAAFSLLLLLIIPQLFPTGIDAKSQQNWLDLFAKFMALAILALSVDLVWGYTGLLSLGQGVFFGLGAYMVAYSLTLQKAAHDMNVPVGLAPPQFMQYTGPAPNDPSYVLPPALSLIAPLG